jgi:hypothetical protein
MVYSLWFVVSGFLEVQLYITAYREKNFQE